MFNKKEPAKTESSMYSPHAPDQEIFRIEMTSSCRESCLRDVNHDFHDPLVPIAFECSYGNCPTIYAISDSSDDVMVQGFVVTTPGMPKEEAMVRIPIKLIKDAAEAI